jgi:hypothetical protein
MKFFTLLVIPFVHSKNPGSGVKDNTSLHMIGLDNNVTEDELRTVFKSKYFGKLFGRVESVTMEHDRRAGNICAHVQFQSTIPAKFNPQQIDQLRRMIGIPSDKSVKIMSALGYKRFIARRSGVKSGDDASGDGPKNIRGVEDLKPLSGVKSGDDASGDDASSDDAFSYDASSDDASGDGPKNIRGVDVLKPLGPEDWQHIQLEHTQRHNGLTEEQHRSGTDLPFDPNSLASYGGARIQQFDLDGESVNSSMQPPAPQYMIGSALALGSASAVGMARDEIEAMVSRAHTYADPGQYRDRMVVNPTAPGAAMTRPQAQRQPEMMVLSRTPTSVRPPRTLFI